MDRYLKVLLRAGSWTVLIGLVALLGAAVVVPGVVGGTAYTVLSPSMRPAVDAGDLVVVRPTDPADIGVGSVITFQLESGKPAVVTHRVVRQGLDKDQKPVFLTEGDANNSPDAIWVRPEQVRGTVWYSLPHVGYLSPLIPGNIRELLVAGVALGLLGYAVLMFSFTIRDKRRVSHA